MFVRIESSVDALRSWTISVRTVSYDSRQGVHHVPGHLSTMSPVHSVPPAGPAASPPPKRVAILGDSVARGTGDESRLGIAGNLRGLSVTNFGIDGARTFTVLRHLRNGAVREAVRGADAVIVSIGGNDLFGDTPARLWSTFAPSLSMRRAALRVRRVVNAVRRENATARIYLLGLYNPYRHRWLDRQVDRWDARLIARFGGHPQVTVIRICDLLRRDDRISALDRFHPGAAGYAAIASRIAASM